MVRVMHPEFGMGIEFASGTAEQREQVGNFIGFLTSRPGTVPQLLITPKALAADNDNDYPQSKVPRNRKICCSTCSIAPILSARKNFSRSFASNAIPRKSLRPKLLVFPDSIRSRKAKRPAHG